MSKRDVAMKAIIITTIFVAILIVVVLLSINVNTLKIRKSEYYDFGNDKIPSIYKVVGKRNLYFYKSNNIDNKIIKTYKYKNVQNVKSDLSNYINELEKNYYTNTSDYDLNNDNGKIQLTNNSVDSKKIIIIDIEYDKDSYIIEITKGYGSINYY